MACTETKQYTEAICDAIEAELVKICNQQQMMEAGNKFHAAKPPTHFEDDAANV